MNTVNKTMVTEALHKLEMFGWMVLTANSNRPMPSGLKGLSDHILIHPKHGIYFVEAKLYKDVLTDKQKVFHDTVKELSYKTEYIDAEIINQYTYLDFIQELLEL